VNTIRLDTEQIGARVIFEDCIESECQTDSQRWIAFHGSNEHSATSIDVEGLKPAKSISCGQLESLRRVSRALSLDPDLKCVEEFCKLRTVNLFPMSQLALHHARTKGGQGLRFRILPLLDKIENHAEYSQFASEHNTLHGIRQVVTATYNANPVVYAVDIKPIQAKAYHKTALAIQVQGEIDSKQLIAKAVVTGVGNYSLQELLAIQRLAIQLRELPKSQHYLKSIVCLED
jgi:hypothetical protein